MSQRIGLAYRTADLIAYRISSNSYPAKSHFAADLLNMGFNKDQAQRLLCEKDWVLRMLLAWEELPALERKKASELDYDKVENY